MKIVLTGAFFNTGNMGVSALTASMITCVHRAFSEAEIIFPGGMGEDEVFYFQVDGEQVPVRIARQKPTKNFFWKRSLVREIIYLILLTLLPFRGLRQRIINTSGPLKAIQEAAFVGDITGGDSFADIYGFRRFFMGVLPKLLTIQIGTPLVLMPQTLGPFRHGYARRVAKYVLKRAHRVYSRDHEGLEEAKALLGKNYDPNRFRFSHDIAFVLEPREPSDPVEWDEIKSQLPAGSVLVGFNISGLLYHGGYTRSNMFELKCDYKELVHTIIERSLAFPEFSILLVPHVFLPPERVESDLAAIQQVYDLLHERYPDRLFQLTDNYDQSEIKYVIGQCDFFIGSRMHACIAALSQGIPAVGIAYSKKFKGVFGSIGLNEYAVDSRELAEDIINSRIINTFEERDIISKHLNNVLPKVKSNMARIFEGLIIPIHS